MKLWTKYRLNQATQPGALYLVKVVAWDENKYCLAWWNGSLYCLKLWYCHPEPNCAENLWEQRKDLVRKIPGRATYFALLEAHKSQIKDQT